MDENGVTRWKEVSDRIHQEKVELEREVERQRLLDELSQSKSRNLELETSLARLAREQDRLALAERERVLKRAQVAQATALLVQEAIWAKSRMENEMNMARQRLRFFQDWGLNPSGRGSTIAPAAYVPTRPPSLFPANGLATENPNPPSMPQAAPPIRASDSIASSSALAHEIPPTIEQPVEVNERRSSQGSSTRADQVQDSVNQAASDVLGATAAVSDALTSTYAGVMSSFMNVIQPVAEPSKETPRVAQKLKASSSSILPSALPEAPVSQPAAAPVTAPVPQTSKPIESIVENEKVPIPNQKPSVASTLGPPKVASVANPTFPGRSTASAQDSNKVVQKRIKGEWTNPDLHAQAGVVLEELIRERGGTIQKKPAVMERLYAVPQKPKGPIAPKTSSSIQPEWTKAADDWVSTAEGSRKGGQPTIKIDPAIASATEGGPAASNEAGGQQGDQPAGDQASAEADAAKKKKCVIM